jgi:hypothetical protein
MNLVILLLVVKTVADAGIAYLLWADGLKALSLLFASLLLVNVASIGVMWHD